MQGTPLINFLVNYWGWIVGGLIVVIGLGIIGRADTSRFSIMRAWAISGVCFDESIRKKVLWITPLAIVGVIVVSQLQRAMDEQDAIRQTIKFCLFASGMVVILSSLILACTNLPKEIESRVIFTIVTKPTTRLEVIVGKILGFARVSGAILLIMGVFTWGYLFIREIVQVRQITARLREGNVSETEKARLDHYRDSGLLTSRTLTSAYELQVFGQRPNYAGDVRTIQGDGEEDVLVGFPVTKEMFPNGAESGVGDAGLVVRVEMKWTRTGPVADSPDPDQKGPVALGPATPTPAKEPPARPPGVSVDIADENFFSNITAPMMVGGTNPEKLFANLVAYLKDKEHKQPWTASKVRLPAEGEKGYAYIWVPPQLASEKMFGHRVFYVRISGTNQNVTYEVGKNPVQVFIPQQKDKSHFAMDEAPAIEIDRLKDEQGNEVPLIFRGRLGIRGEQQIVGTATGPAASAVYTFRGTPEPQIVNGQIPFEISNLQIQRSNDSDSDETHEDPTTLSITVHDLKSGKETPAALQVETRQLTFFTVPAGAISGPDYDVIIQCANKGHTVGFYAQSLQLVIGRQMFAVNLAKSLFIIWMMSILVIVLAIMCSTFVNWPIAIVLTVILLLSHWGVNQLSDVNGPGLGRMMVNDLKIGDKDAPVAKVFSSTVDSLSVALNAFAKVLPDTEKFDAIGNVEEGTTVPMIKLWAALKVVLSFGIPASILGYWRLKWKEVAP